MVDLSFFNSVFQMKELQIFFAIIIIGIVVYVIIMLFKSLIKWIFFSKKEDFMPRKEKHRKMKLEDLDKTEEEIERTETKEAAKEVGKREGAIAIEKVEVEEKPVFTFEINLALFERVFYVLVIIAEIAIILYNIFK